MEPASWIGKWAAKPVQQREEASHAGIGIKAPPLTPLGRPPDLPAAPLSHLSKRRKTRSLG